METDSSLQIAHVLFLDVVSYSRVLSSGQRELIHLLNRIAAGTPAFPGDRSSGQTLAPPDRRWNGAGGSALANDALSERPRYPGAGTALRLALGR